VSEKFSDRRSFVRKLVSLAAMGTITSLLLRKTDVIPSVRATDGDIIHVGDSLTATTETFLDGNVSGNPTFGAFNSNTSFDSIGVFGNASGASPNVSGVYGKASAGGVGVTGLGQGIGGIGVHALADAGATVALYADGLVGVGTAAPGELLHVSNSGNNLLMLQSTHGFAGNTANLDFQTYATINNQLHANARVSAIDDGTFSASLAFLTKIPGADTNGLVERMRIADGGNVGIGTSAPEAQLHVGGGATQDVFCGLGPHPNTIVSGQYVGPAMNYGYAGNSFGEGAGFFNVRPDPSATPPNPSLRFMTNNIQRIIIDNNGNVGIGNNFSSPTHLIQLSGGAYSDGTNWTSVSSVRWKENIEPLTQGLETLKQLHPVAYNYKKTPAKRTMGFIAEEVGKVLPTVVDWDEKEEGYAEGYDHLAILALVVEAVKEQQAEIEQLKAENKTLREVTERISELEGQITTG
jgi:hypothetical protein